MFGRMLARALVRAGSRVASGADCTGVDGNSRQHSTEPIAVAWRSIVCAAVRRGVGTA